MHRVPKIATVLFSLIIAGCGGSIDPFNAGQTGENPQPFELSILHINDHHSHLDSETVTLQLNTGANKREAIRVERGGFPRVVSAIKALRQQSSNVLTLHSGDATTGDLYYTLTEGKADAELMNLVCFDALTLGNHEFDRTDAGVKKLMELLHTGTCKTPVLSANVRFGPSSPLHGATPPEAVLPAVIVERGGQKIGIIGLTVSGKTKHSSRANPDTTFIDEAKTAQAAIDHLQAQGVDKIILTTHIGYLADLALVKRLRGVDVIVGADSHSLLGPDSLRQYGLTPEGPYPTKATDQDGKPVCITQAWQYGYVVGEARVQFTAQGEVSDCSGTPWVLIGDPFSRPESSTPLRPEEIAAVRGDIADSGVLRITEPDPQATALLAPYAQQKEAMGSTVVATARENLCLRRVPGNKRDTSRSTLGDICNANARVIAHGGDIQQIVAEAFLQQGKDFFGADLSIQNGGGVRADLASGKITVQDVYTVLPFKNTLIQLNATGAEVKAALEDAVEGVAGPANNTGCYPYTGGLRFHLDLNQPKGKRLSHLEIKDKAGTYRPFDLKATYKVAVMSFLADGNDSYTTLKTITGERRIDVGLDYAEAFLQYIRKLPGDNKVLVPLPPSDYSTQHFVDTPEP